MENLRKKREEILRLVADYHREAFAPRDFVPGESVVRYAGRVFDADELVQAVEASLDFWLTAGRFAEEFESELAARLGLDAALLVNSGSSANLVAFSALTSPSLGDRRVRPGDEVITVAAGFPTTVNPIIQNRAVPVFIDVELATYVPTVEAVAAAVTPRTKAVMIAHTMGIPFDAAAVRDLCRKRGLWLVEDCCDALGDKVGRATARHVRRPRLLLLLSGASNHPRRRRGRRHRRRAVGPRSPARSATGAATAIAAAAKTTPAASDSASSSARCPTGTTTSTSIRTSATT